MSRRSDILLPLILLQMSLMVITTSHHSGVGGEDIKHSVMLAHYAGCNVRWQDASVSYQEWEDLVCSSSKPDGSIESAGTAYEDSEKHWTAYAFGVDGKTFRTREEAKGYVDTQLRYWLRPKAEWWKFWKEFKERE